MKRLLFVFLFLILFSGALAVIQQDSMKIFAVTSEGQGLSADLIVSIEPGSGTVWSSVKPLVGTTTQSAERTAVDVAKIYSADTEKYDYKFEINSNASVVEGPSAGAAMTLLTVSMLRNKHVPQNVSMTGTIASDGSVGPVGGVFEKAKEASNQGIKLFLVPKGEAKQIVKMPSGVQSVNLIEYASSQWGLKIVEVENMDQALKLAFSDVGSIDLNRQVDENIFDFLPEPIANSGSLVLMHDITARYIEASKAKVDAAKKALNSSMIEDNTLVQSLLGALSNSEDTLNEAELLLDRNFLYSAANYAYLAKANAMLVADVAENPSLLSANSTLFHSRLIEMRQKIQLLEEDLGKYIPLDYLEWHIAAQERAVYAENNIGKLLSSQTIVISDSTDSAPQYDSLLKNLQDYEYSVAWYEIAQEFAAESAKSTKKIKPDGAFKESIDPLLVQIENKLAVLPKDEIEDIQRRYDSAKREQELGWYLAAGYDAASAIALINASIEIKKDNDLNILYTTVKATTAKVSGEISKSWNPYIWANLYLDHTGYFVSGADYYIKQKQEAKALEAIKSAVSIAFLAENMLVVSKDYYSHYNSIPLEKISKENNELDGAIGKPSENPWQSAIMVIIFAAGLAVGVLIAVRLVHKVSKQRNYPLQQQVTQLIDLQKGLEKALAEGGIPKEQYFSLQEKYSERLNLLQSEIKDKSEQVVEIDSLRARMIGLEHVMRSLKSHFEAGLVLNDDYKKQVSLIQKEIDSLKLEIESQKKELSSHEQQIKTQTVSDLKRETEKIEKEEKSLKKAKASKPQKKK